MSKMTKDSVLAILSCCFLIMCEHTISGSISNSLFLENVGSNHLIHLWMASSTLLLVLSAEHKKRIHVHNAHHMFLCITCLVVILNPLLVAFSDHTWPIVVLCIWRDTYVPFLFQCLWTIIYHDVHNKRNSVALYGMMFGAGGLGTLIGGSVSNQLASSLGTKWLISSSVILSFLNAMSFSRVERQAPLSDLERMKIEHKKTIAESLKNKILIINIISLFCLNMIFCISDLQLQKNIEKEFSSLDKKTEFLGKLSFMMGVSVIALSGVFAPLVYKLIGLRKMYYSVPQILLVAALACYRIGFLDGSTLMYMIVKTCDAGILSVVKSISYTTVSEEERKASQPFIDVFLPRFAKYASAILLSFCLFFTRFISESSLFSLLFVFISMFWMICIRKAFAKK